MATFMLETSSLESAASSLDQVSSNISTLSSSVSGYDTSCEDGFDFSSAKSKIAANLEACSTKVKNTSNILNTVVGSHTQLQNSLKVDNSSETKTKSQETNSTTKNGSSNNNRNYSSRTTSSGGGYYSGGSSSGGGGYVSSIPTNTPTINKENEKEEQKIVTIKNHFSKVGYACVDSSKLKEESKNIMEHDNIKYDKNGYAKIGKRFIVAVDSSVGKVGDVLRFTQKDGTELEAIIGVTTTNTKNKDNISFIISTNEKESFKASDFSKKLIEDNKKIENCGTFDSSIIKTISNEKLKSA